MSVVISDPELETMESVEKKLSAMKTTQIQTEKGVVQEMRRIREQLSREIQDMTFEQERAYLDKLLDGKRRPASDEEYIPASRA